MVYNPLIHGRRSIRLSNFDYSQNGWYFITICTQDRKYLFGKIFDNKMVLNQLGKIVQDWWLKIPKRFGDVLVDKYVIMPNHIHGIMKIDKNIKSTEKTVYELTDIDSLLIVGAIHESPLRRVKSIHESPLQRVKSIHESPLQKLRRKMLLSKIIGYFKMNSAKQINNILLTSGRPVWQRNYYEHIIWDEGDYWRIVNYIETNPENWESDRNYKK